MLSMVDAGKGNVPARLASEFIAGGVMSMEDEHENTTPSPTKSIYARNLMNALEL